MSTSEVQICTCDACIASGNVVQDEVFGQIPGRLLTYPEFLKHQNTLPAATSSIVDIPPSHARFVRSRSRIASVHEISDEDRSTLDAIRSQLATRAAAFPDLSQPLLFTHPPTDSMDDDVPIHDNTTVAFNAGAYPLVEGAAENAGVLNYQSWLITVFRQVQDIAAKYSLAPDHLAVDQLRDVIIEQLTDLEVAKGKEWERQQALLLTAGKCEQIGIPVFRAAPTPPLVTQPIFFACYMLLTVLHIFCAVSLHRCDQFILPVLKLVLRLHEQYLLGTKKAENKVSEAIPGTIKKVTSSLRLDPTLVTFICCKDCFACYSPTSHPRHCVYKSAPDAPPCGRALTCKRNRKGKRVEEPEREIHCQDFRSWLAELLSRPGMEEMLERNPYNTGAAEGELRDVWDGKVLRNFRGADGKNFFIHKGPGEIHLAFSLCEDNFNPFFNKHGGKSYSAGVICLICLNLPPHLRYLLENVFIFCVFPGPKEPKLEQINNVMRFLVDQFCVFWAPGVFYDSTPRYPRGRLVQAAIVLLLGDLMAVRKISGISKWCTQCPILAMDIDNLKPETWPAPRSGEEHRRLAEEWKLLGTKARIRHFARYGIRWSELLRLPYFDMPTFTAIELSHNLLTNCAEHHLRSLWGMDSSLPDGLGDKVVRQRKKREAHPTEIEHAWQVVHRGTKNQLADIPAIVLVECCKRAGEPNGGKKMALLEALENYRIANGIVDANGLPVNPLPKTNPSDSPTEYETYEAESALSRAQSAKPLLRLRKRVVEALISSRIEEEPEALDTVLDVMSRGSSQLDSDFIQDSSDADTSRESVRSSLILGSRNKGFLSDVLWAIESRKREKRKLAGEESETHQKSAVLGAQTLAHIHEDIQRMTLPSWIGRVPHNLGTKSHGTLSQDALRTTVTVILVSSLPRIWGTEPEGSRKREMLTNFLDFSVAADIALMRSITIDAIDDNHDRFLKYLRGVRTLFPHRGLIPNQHLSLHLKDTLKNHGPAPGQRTNLLERINFLLQKTHTNSKPGEMELTMIRRLCTSQQIRASMARLPAELEPLRHSFVMAFDSDDRGTLQSESGGYFNNSINYSNWTVKEQIPQRLYELLCALDPDRIPSRTALFQTSFTFRRASYSAASTGRADSYVIFGNYPLGRWYAGQITDIMVQERDEGKEFRVHVAVRHYRELTKEDKKHDFYLAEGRADALGDIGRLFYRKKSEHTTLIDVKDIVCHCTINPVPVANVSEKAVHIRPHYRGGVCLD